MVIVDLGKVDNNKELIELSFRRASERTRLYKQKRKNYSSKLEKAKALKAYKLESFTGFLHARLVKIIHAFPNFKELDEFYRELIASVLDFAQLKKSLGAVDWSAKQVTKFNSQFQKKLRSSRDLDTLAKHENAAYGRLSSVLKQIRKNLLYLEQTRRTFKSLPSIKTGLKSVVITGFPNVGKTTLLSKLTGSKPEINSYAFTTKSINVGYIKREQERIQVLDTPGTLNRFEGMNPIEKQAWLCLKHLADVVIYVFDLTESYPLPDQEKLYKKVKKQSRVPVHIYLSKADILGKEEISEFNKMYKTTSDPNKLVEKI